MDVTIIIPAHNSDLYIQRSVSYWGHYEFNVIICDSSIKPYNGDAGYCSYVHCPGASFQSKVCKVLANLNTKYAVLCAQDDFLLPSGIKKCIEALEEWHDFGSAQGAAFRFDQTYLKTRKLNPAYPQMWIKRNASPNDAMERLSWLLNYYHQLLYSVCRTNHLQRAFQGTLALNVDQSLGGIMELIVGVGLILQSRSLFIPYPYWIRDTFPGSWGGNVISFREWLEDSGHEETRREIAHNLESLCPESKEESLNLLLLASCEYYKFHSVPKRRRLMQAGVYKLKSKFASISMARSLAMLNDLIDHDVFEKTLLSFWASEESPGIPNDS